MEPQEKELHKQNLLAAARNLTRLQHDEIRARRRLKFAQQKNAEAQERQYNAYTELDSALEAWYLSNLGFRKLSQELRGVMEQIQSLEPRYTLTQEEIMLSCVGGDEVKLLQATEQFGQLHTQLSQLRQTRMRLQNASALASQANNRAMLRRDQAQAQYDTATAAAEAAQAEVRAAAASLPSSGAESEPLHEAVLRAAMAYAGVAEGARLFTPIYLHKLDVSTVLPGD